LRKLLSDVFPAGEVEVTSFGNLISSVASLHGLEPAELATPELEHADPWHPLVVCARAVKAPLELPPAVHTAGGDGAAAVLLYHRVASLTPDSHGLCTPPETFESHMAHLRRRCVPLDLEELVELARVGRLPKDAVAVTFDDGYLDGFVASDILSGLGVPATFFVNGEDLAVEHEAWWDVVEGILLADETALPPVLELVRGQARHVIPTASREERRTALQSVHGVLLYAAAAERKRLVQRIVSWSGTKPSVRSSHRLMTAAEIVELGRRPGHSVGAHTTHHLLLSSNSVDVQREEIVVNRRELESLLGHAVTSFSYPYGEFTAETIDLVREAGFTTAVTVEAAPVRDGVDPLRIPRFEVKGASIRSFPDDLTRLLAGAGLGDG
jgi:peptidoglycan/xylan/chitin deacetylase (PgdA/CDA1 family)